MLSLLGSCSVGDLDKGKKLERGLFIFFLGPCYGCLLMSFYKDITSGSSKELEVYFVLKLGFTRVFPLGGFSVLWFCICALFASQLSKKRIYVL